MCDAKQFASKYAIKATTEEKQSFLNCAMKLMEQYGDNLPDVNTCSSDEAILEATRAIMAL